MSRSWSAIGAWASWPLGRLRAEWSVLVPTIEPFLWEWRQLKAARDLALAVARASSDPLTEPKAGLAVEPRVAAVCEAVTQLFKILGRPKGEDDAQAIVSLLEILGRPKGEDDAQAIVRLILRLRKFLSRRARACDPASEPEAREHTLLNTAFTLWGDAVSSRRLGEKLTRRAKALDGNAEGFPPSFFWRVVQDALWEAEAADGPGTKQRRRNWNNVRGISLGILPPAKEKPGERCTLEHFRKVLGWIRRHKPSDHNLPRKLDAVGELFYLFCPSCAGAANPYRPGYRGLARGDGSCVEEQDWAGTDDADPDPAIDYLDRLAPKGTRAMLDAFKASASGLRPRDQVVLSYLLGILDVVGDEAKRAYPGLDEEAVKTRNRIAAVLRVDPQALSEDLQRMDDWRNAMVRKLQQDLLPPKGGE